MLIQTVRGALIRESLLACGRTAPNPPVAAVVLAAASAPGDPAGDKAHPDLSLLFPGGTEPAGGRHAEIVALDACREAEREPGKLYVTLEPCSHHGRTPPCTDRILGERHLERIVVYGRDPNLREGGIERLRNAGRRVGLIRSGRFDPGLAFLGGFLSRVAGRGPRYHCKLALTADGFMAGVDRERLMISGPPALAFGMALRSRVDAVLVGPGTVADDRPGLDLRSGPRDDSFDFSRLATVARDHGDLWLNAFFTHFEEVTASFTDSRYQPDRIFFLGRPFAEEHEFFARQEELASATGRKAVYLTTEKHAGHRSRRALAVLPNTEAPGFPGALREFLGDRGYNEVMIEGGPTFLDRLVLDFSGQDRLYVLRSRSVRAAAGRRIGAELQGRLRTQTGVYDLGGDSLETYGG